MGRPVESGSRPDVLAELLGLGTATSSRPLLSKPGRGVTQLCSNPYGTDKDEYWVAFPEFAHCDASKVTVSCTVPKP
ncbi:hypothetical protein SPURM210S_03903 [Streptomyces purpurascens]